MSPVREVYANDPWGAILWIDEVRRSHPEYTRALACVFREMHTLACVRRTNQIHMTLPALAREIGSSETSISTATRILRLHGLEAKTTRDGVIWTFPPEWCRQPFRDDRTASLFPVENLGEQKATTTYSPGPLRITDQADGLLPRAQNGEQKAMADYGPGPGITPQAARNGKYQATLKLAQENQHVEPLVVLKNNPGPGDQAATLNRSIEVFSSRDIPATHRVTIDRVNAIPASCGKDALALRSRLRDYWLESRPHHEIPDGPDETIVAQCLAAAPLARLFQVISTMEPPKRRNRLIPGEAWAWWPVVFCQRVHHQRDISKVEARDPAFYDPAKDKTQNQSNGGGEAPQTQKQNHEFRDSLLHQVAGAGRKLS